MERRILITLGPSSFNDDFFKKFNPKNVALFRINLSHTRLEDVEKVIRWIQARTDIPVCIDTEGAQIRNRVMKDNPTLFQRGDTVTLCSGDILGDREKVAFTPEGIVKDFNIGDIVKIDFDSVSMEVVGKENGLCTALVSEGGNVSSNKAVNLDRDIALPPLSEKDREAIKIGKKLGVKHMALSFVHSPDDVRLFRELTGDATIISKIETRSCLEHLDEVIELSDEVLIDRGDLSRQVPIEKIPFVQMEIIDRAKKRNTPVHVATNLLETMVTSKNPTRAETNDVVSTLAMGANGLVLAAETAAGKYPLESIEIIQKLIDQYEKWTPDMKLIDILEN